MNSSMRFLVISDIHANATALAAALAAAEGRWERAICLGDVVGYGPDPNEVIDRVRGMVEAIIRGNHDKAVSGLGDPEELESRGARRGRMDARPAPPRKSPSISRHCPPARSKRTGSRSCTAHSKTKTNMFSRRTQALASLLAAPA